MNKLVVMSLRISRRLVNSKLCRDALACPLLQQLFIYNGYCTHNSDIWLWHFNGFIGWVRPNGFMS